MCTTIYIYILAQPRNYLAIIRTTIKNKSIFRFFHFKKQFVVGYFTVQNFRDDRRRTYLSSPAPLTERMRFR